MVVSELIVDWLHRRSQGMGGVSVPGSRDVSWCAVASQACRAAGVLARRGIQPGDRVALGAGNSLEWIVADLAIQMLGGVVVPLHISLSGQQLAWQLQHSGSKLLIGDTTILGKVTELPAHLITIPLPLWTELVSAGDETAGRERWQVARKAITPESLATIVYTSGTSGEPRGVMLTHGNLAANAMATLSAFGRRADDLRLNSLPFSHAFGRMSDLYVSLAADTRLALTRSRETLIADAQLVQPTLMVVVPLLLARLRQAAVAQFGEGDAAAVQKLLGGRLRGFICGGAALADEVRDYFAAQGTPIHEGYGLTEAGPVVSASSESAVSPPGSVGRLLPGTTARTADDGELLIYGPQVMAGYWRDEEATKQALQAGWLHTGDLGSVDDDGFLTLHGRKKEFIALASGKKVWPAAIEELFAGDSLIDQLLIVGEGETSLGALVVVREKLTDQARVLSHLAERLKGHAAHEQIRRVWLLTEPWTAEREELTPKMTLRRSVILRRYADCIKQLFAK